MSDRERPDPDDTHRPHLSRRTFLAYGGTTLAAFVVPACGGDATSERVGDLDVSNLDASDWITIQRPDDLVNLRVGLVNFRRDGNRIVRTGSPGLIVVQFPPQHLAEKVFLEGGPAPDAPPIATNVAQESRVVFVVPEPATELPLSSEQLLWLLGFYAINVHANAAPPVGLPVPQLGGGTTSGAQGIPVAPDELETAIELPWRVLLSPNAYARWAHAAAPVTSDRGRVELWHTRLGVVNGNGVGIDEGPNPLRAVRAIWARDLPDPFPVALPQAQRAAMVALTADWRVDVRRHYTPPDAMAIEQLMLSSLGGWLDGTLQVTRNAGIGHWIHRSAMGRDYYVEVAHRGYAFPFQHEVMILEITERKLEGTQDAYLWKRFVPLVVERTRTYDGAGFPSLDPMQRAMPLERVSLVDEHLPNVQGPPAASTPYVLRTLDGQPLRFRVVAYDRGGNRITVKAPILWVPFGEETDPGRSGQHHLKYASDAQPRIDTGGQRLRVAATRTSDDRGDTTFETHALTFTGGPLPADAWSSGRFKVGFHPFLLKAEMAVDAIRQLTGKERASDGNYPAFQYSIPYIQHGFDTTDGRNPRELMMQLAPGIGLQASFSNQADRAGGFVTPNLDIKGLSRISGPISDLATTVAASPTALFPSDSNPLALFNAKIFGCIRISDIIDPSSFASMAPKFVTDTLDELGRLRNLASDLAAKMSVIEGMVENPPIPASMAADVEAQVRQYARDVFAVVDDVAGFLPQALDELTALPERFTGSETDAEINAALARLLDDGLIGRLDEVSTILVSHRAAPFLYPLVPDLEVRLRTIAGAIQQVARVAASVKDVVAHAIRARSLLKNQQVTIDWKPPLRSFGPFVVRPGGGLTLSATVRGKAQGDQPAGADLLCALEKIDLVLVPGNPIITLHVDKLQFRQRMGKKPEIDVVFGGFEFGGPLAFIQTLKEALPLDGFSDPPAVDVTSTGLVASYSIGLPALAVGMFCLENVAIGARLDVPFIGDAMGLKFQFSSREKPFLLTVSGLGGTGYFGLVVTPAGVTMLEAQLEFGAHVSLNFGVASGAVTVMGGIYFGLQTLPTVAATVIGFIRIRGEVDVLGIISASIELRMELEYRTGAGGGKLIGRASLEIEISIAFFSKTVRVECERKLAGANGDPTFAQIMGPDAGCAANDECFPWLAYCGAFAA